MEEKKENKELFQKSENKKILNSFKYAFCGIVTGIKKETNLKIHILIMVLVIIAGVILKISPLEWIICIILFGLVIFAELINTAIETVVDMITPYKNDKAKIAKDVAARKCSCYNNFCSNSRANYFYTKNFKWRNNKLKVKKQ